MNPEQARQLIRRGTQPGHQGPVPEHGSVKRREIRFKTMPPGQMDKAFDLLNGLEFLDVLRGPHPLGLTVSYDLLDYTLEGLENALRKIGFHLDTTLYSKIVRALVYFTEETQLRNLQEPARLIKQSNQVYIEAYQHHLHGDRDDTPPEAREDR